MSKKAIPLSQQPVGKILRKPANAATKNDLMTLRAAETVGRAGYQLRDEEEARQFGAFLEVANSWDPEKLRAITAVMKQYDGTPDFSAKIEEVFSRYPG